MENLLVNQSFKSRSLASENLSLVARTRFWRGFTIPQKPITIPAQSALFNTQVLKQTAQRVTNRRQQALQCAFAVRGQCLPLND